MADTLRWKPIAVVVLTREQERCQDVSQESDNSFGSIDIFWTNKTNLSTGP